MSKKVVSKKQGTAKASKGAKPKMKVTNSTTETLAIRFIYDGPPRGHRRPATTRRNGFGGKHQPPGFHLDRPKVDPLLPQRLARSNPSTAGRTTVKVGRPAVFLYSIRKVVPCYKPVVRSLYLLSFTIIDGGTYYLSCSIGKGAERILSNKSLEIKIS